MAIPPLVGRVWRRFRDFLEAPKLHLDVQKIYISLIELWICVNYVPFLRKRLPNCGVFCGYFGRWRRRRIGKRLVRRRKIIIRRIIID